MLHLLESATRRRERGAGWTAASTAMHASVIAIAAFAGTRDVVERMEPEPASDRIVYSVAPEPARRPATGAAATPIPVSRPPLAIPTIPAPRYTGFVDPVLPQTLASIPLGPAGILPVVPGPGGNATHREGEVWIERAVDRAVTPLAGNRQPDYPQQLRSAAVQGEVLVRFIVDTSGRVEPASIDVALATHTLFAESVRRWLSRNRYAPAQVVGAPVRQLVEQRIGFTLR